MPGGNKPAPWTSGSKTNAVQHAVVNARIVEINRREHGLKLLFIE